MKVFFVFCLLLRGVDPVGSVSVSASASVVPSTEAGAGSEAAPGDAVGAIVCGPGSIASTNTITNTITNTNTNTDITGLPRAAVAVPLVVLALALGSRGAAGLVTIPLLVALCLLLSGIAALWGWVFWLFAPLRRIFHTGASPSQSNRHRHRRGSRRMYHSKRRELFARRWRIEQSLRIRDFQTIRWNRDPREQQREQQGEQDANRGNDPRPRCCPICLEEFKPGDNDKHQRGEEENNVNDIVNDMVNENENENDTTIVSGPRDCCGNNIFHKACILAWLLRPTEPAGGYRCNDSCPCCRSPLLATNERSNDKDNENENDEYECERTIAAEDEAYARHVRSLYRRKMAEATLRRNAVVAAYLEREAQERQRQRERERQSQREPEPERQRERERQPEPEPARTPAPP